MISSRKPLYFVEQSWKMIQRSNKLESMELPCNKKQMQHLILDFKALLNLCCVLRKCILCVQYVQCSKYKQSFLKYQVRSLIDISAASFHFGFTKKNRHSTIFGHFQSSLSISLIPKSHHNAEFDKKCWVSCCSARTNQNLHLKNFDQSASSLHKSGECQIVGSHW